MQEPTQEMTERNRVDESTRREGRRQSTRLEESPVMGGLTIRELEALPRGTEQLGDVSVGGTTNIREEVIAAVAGVSASEVDGVAGIGSSSIGRNLMERFGPSDRRTRGVTVQAGRREAIIDIVMQITYGYSIPEVVSEVRQRIAQQVLLMCGLITKEINVTVNSMDFPERASTRVE